MCMQICSALTRHYDGGVCTDMKAICQTEIKRWFWGIQRDDGEKNKLSSSKNDKALKRYIKMCPYDVCAIFIIKGLLTQCCFCIIGNAF